MARMILALKPPHPPLNGPVHILCEILRNVMSSAAEAELGGLFRNGQEGSALRTTLEEMGWKQEGPTLIQLHS